VLEARQFERGGEGVEKQREEKSGGTLKLSQQTDRHGTYQLKGKIDWGK